MIFPHTSQFNVTELFSKAYKRTINAGHFNAEHTIVNLNKIYQLHLIPTIYSRIKARTDGQINQIHKHFHFLENVKKKNKTLRDANFK